MHPSLTLYDATAGHFIQTDFDIRQLAGDCLFTEGPVWNKDGFYLFSDIPANCIYRIGENTGREIFLNNSGTSNTRHPDLNPQQAGSNALAYDAAGDLLVCQHGDHGISKFRNGKLESFIREFGGRPFNSPNDLVLHEDGRIWFSDPPYGLKDGKLNPGKYQEKAGVYLWKDGVLSAICDRYHYPNGVCLSPDRNELFICSNKPFERFISVYRTEDNAFLKILAEENSDGMECDWSGNIFLCTREGLVMLSPAGKRLARIELPTVPSNCCWGGEGLKDLLVTARENVFLIKGLSR